MEYEFIGKGLYIKKQGILAIGDLHLGYESMLTGSGSYLKLDQFEQTKKELIEII